MLEQQLARSQPACPVCRSWIEPDYIACPVCATMLRQQCATCNAPLEPLWQLCPYCASAIQPSEADLDAALTAETQRITLVDDIPLVPRPETAPRTPSLALRSPGSSPRSRRGDSNPGPSSVTISA